MPLLALDPRTLLFSLSLLGFLAAGLSISVARPAGDTRQAILAWSRAMLCVGVAFQLILFHDALPPFVPYVAGNALVAALPLFALLACQQLFGRRPWTRAAAWVFAAQAAALAAMHFGGVPRPTVVLALCAALAGEFAFLAALVIRERRHGPPALRWIAASTLVVVALVFATRVGAVLAGAGPAITPAAGSAMHIGALLATALAIVGSTIAFVLMAHEREYREALERARRDSLTGLHTRRELFDELARLDARHASHALMMIDVDRFKAINDAHGHTAGDAVLAHVGRLLRRSIRDNDVAVRYGGDEFGVLLRGCAGADATRFAERVVAEIAAHPVRLPDGNEMAITVSAGCALHPAGLGAGDPAAGALRMLERADAALYDAKRAGRNRAVTRIAARATALEPGAAESATGQSPRED